MNSIFEVEELIQTIEGEMDNKASVDISEGKKQKYLEYVNYLKGLQKKLAIDSYKFVFIGDKGIGKTSTILELFGLVNNNGDLLTTASGGTTTCEVEILKSEEAYSYFEIIPADDDLMKQYIYDFCLSYKTKDRDGKPSENQYVPTEIARSIRNMLGMKKQEIKETYDKFDSFESFMQFVNDKLSLTNRTETIVRCSASTNNSNFQEVQKKFSEINLCKNPYLKLPQKINLYLTKDIIDFSDYPYIGSIIDTRGIDSSLTASEDDRRVKREDIIRYVDLEQENCVFLFMDGIKPAPSPSIINIFKSRITKENANKFYSLINIYDNEAEEVMTDEGKALDVQVGIDYKREDILEKFDQNAIDFNQANLIFYNARKNFPDRVEILDKILANINSQKKKLYDDSQQVKDAFERLKYDFENKEYALKNFEELYLVIRNIFASKDILTKIATVFIDKGLKKLHHARLDAINRNYGNYYAYNFYFQFSMVIEETFDEVFAEQKNNIVKKVEEFFNYKNINDLDKIDYKMYIEKLEKDYISCRNILKEDIKERLMKTCTNQFWEKTINQYGRKHTAVRGELTYTERVCEIYDEVISILNKSYNFCNEYNKKWNNILCENYIVSSASN